MRKMEKISESINDLQDEIHANAVNKGWYDDWDGEDPDKVAAKLCLIHSEVSEALEALRDGQIAAFRGEGGKPEGLETELADVVIRVLDLSCALGFDLGDAIIEKIAFNLTRDRKHGGKVI